VTEVAWCAGFLDGEGNFRFSPTAGWRGQLKAQATQIHRSVLERLQRTLGGHISGPYSHGGRPNAQPKWEWYITKFETFQQAVCLLWPYLDQVKKDQIRLAFKEAYRAWKK
jgi:hypothetical protein